jgi:predicted PurR-regulated permease PerM
MDNDKSQLRDFLARDLTDFFIRLGLLALALLASERIFAPFLPIVLWALILATCFYPLVGSIRRRTDWSAGRASSLLVLALVLLIGVPTVMLGSSFATHIFDVVAAFRANELQLDPPSEAVRAWPVVGEHIYALWLEAATDMPAFVEQLQPQLGNFTRAALGAAASTAGTLLFFIGALIVAGIMMAYGEGGAAVLQRLACRLAGPERGRNLHRLATLTVRSVATGVVGVAFIQALLLGIGFLLAGIPAAGLLALVTLVVGILQLPALIISLPAIGYLWGMGDAGTPVNAALTVYFLLAGAADNVLKPMLLGRGVDVPMPVVLIGALGGMVGGGIVGLFVGAVVLSVAYELFMGWLNADAADPAPSDEVGPTS